MTTATDFADVPKEDINPFDPEVLKCPFHYNKKLREEAPVYQDSHTGIFMVSSYELAAQVVKDHVNFSNKFGAAMRGSSIATVPEEIAEIQKEGWPAIDTMLTQDQPEHTRYRGLVSPAFSQKRITDIIPYMYEVANNIVDQFIDKGECEFLHDFAIPLPLTLIASQLGVPLEDMPKFRHWTECFVAQLSQMADKETQIEAAKGVVEFQKYFHAKLEETRANPTDNILSDIVNARIEGERPLDDPECLSILQQLLVAGNETTASALTEGMYQLAKHPDQAELARNDSSLIPGLVEEVLRFTTPTANMWRVVLNDTEVGGMMIPKGAITMVRYKAANADDIQFENADQFDITRKNARRHIAFGQGIHMCPGANLARKDMQIGFEVLLKRLDNIRLNVDEDSLVHPPNVLLYGLQQLPIAFDKRTV
ncbi:MAG: cytochrome P450 [Pseudomonadota bacterium]